MKVYSLLKTGTLNGIENNNGYDTIERWDLLHHNLSAQKAPGHHV